MCGQCAFLAAAGASGARAWLGSRRFTWLTPTRLRAATVALVVVGLVASSVLVGGSSPEPTRPMAAEAGTAASAQAQDRSP